MKLLKHGEHIRASYAASAGESVGAIGGSTSEERPGGQMNGVVKRFRKGATASTNPHALGWIKAIYADAIEYSGYGKDLRGIAFIAAIFHAFVIVPLTTFIGISMIQDGASDDLFPLITGSLILLGAGGFGVYLSGTFFRHCLWQPNDLPVIFDRKNRRIYRILRDEQSGLKGVFMAWPIKACAYEWKLVDAEHNAEIISAAGGVTRNHFLMFAVRKSAKDPTIIDSFQIANALVLSDELVPCMWEHIRRFMVEQGPHLPTPDEPLASTELSRTWWQSMGTVGVFGPQYFRSWKEKPIFTLFCHAILPVFLPLNLLWGTGNWLSGKTAITVDWPDEVKRAVGKPIRTG